MIHRREFIKAGVACAGIAAYRNFSIAVLGLVLGCTAPLYAEVKLNSVFTDNMVLQRDIPAKVFGTADDGETVTVSINGQTVKATAAKGEWLVKLKPMKAGGPYTLTVNGSKTITCKNVVLGDVWLCTGQSNMDFDFAGFARFTSPKLGEIGKQYIQMAADAAKFKNLRMLVAAKAPGKTKIPELKIESKFKGSWQVSSEQYANLTSAVGYVFGLKLHQHLKVPIGLIDTNKGGTPVETWMSDEALKAAGLKAEKKSYYNGNIFPIQKFAIKGVIWYQGESNAKTVDSSIAYGKTFPTMIEYWRKEWGQGDFPFLYVQLAGLDRKGNTKITWPLLRESQDKALALPNVGAALAIDIGSRSNIHPPQKFTVSERLVLAARKHGYGENLIYSGPRYASHKVKGETVEVAFDHVGGGLIKKAFTMEKDKISDAKVLGFEISTDGITYVPADATIKGDKVIVSSAEVMAPKHVRYAWSGFPIANLFNKEGLPTLPFRTDSNSPSHYPPPRKLRRPNIPETKNRENDNTMIHRRGFIKAGVACAGIAAYGKDN